MRRFAPLGLLLATLAVFALVAELGLRLAMPWLALPPFRAGGYSDSMLHHRYPPSARMHDRFGLGRYVVETNEDGLRTPWSRAAFLEQGVRVALLGDSFTFGYGVAGDETFATGLEAQLRERLGRSDVAVLNAGIITYSPLLERALFEDVIRHYSPTLTLLVLDISDIADDHMYAGQLARRDGSRRFALEDEVWPDSRLDRVALWNLARPLRRALGLGVARPAPLRGRRPASIEVDGVVQRDHFFVMRLPLDKTRPFFDAMLRNIELLADQVRSAGGEFALAIGPRHVHWDPTESPHNYEAGRYGADATWHAEYLRYFEQWAPRLGFPVVPLLPAFEGSLQRPLVFDHDPHWNPAGHAVVAGALADFVVAQTSRGED